jgi:nucleotide-binding universal stress UspA family protein
VTGQHPAPVVAGIDGSAPSRTAAELAAWEAVRGNRTLRLVCGFEQPLTAGQVMLPPDVVREPLEGAANVLKELAGVLQHGNRGLRVETQVTVGNPATVLVDESRNAALVVLGSRGLGGFTGLLVGSVSTQVATHARAPVMVVRGAPRGDPHARPAPGDGPVVVGVDGSSRSTAAVEFAMDEAADRDQPLIAVHGYQVPQDTRDEARPVPEEATAGAAGRYPKVRVEHRVVEAQNPARALLDVGDEVDASLMVVGSRGRHGFSGLLLGSVGQAVLGHAHRTVAVVHPHRGT